MKPHLCPECKRKNIRTAMKKGKALENTLTGVPDFIGSKEIATVHAGGSGKLISCLKCPVCGHSEYK